MKAVFLQTRLNSVRLPKKALLPLEGIPLVEWSMRRLKQIEADCYVLLTCESDAATLRLNAARCGFELFTGSETDVLNRFAEATRLYRPDRILRATGDNPFVSPVLAEETWRQAEAAGADYAVLKDIPTGSSVEAARAGALLAAEAAATEPYDREHVMPYLYHHPETFAVIGGAPPEGYRSRLSVTVDTEEDYRRVACWASGLTPETFSLKHLIASQPQDGDL